MHPLWLAIRLPRLPLEVLPPAATESTPRNARAEREALKALCAAAYQFSGTVTAQPRAPEDRIRTVWLEVGASLRLFGGLESLLARLAARGLPDQGGQEGFAEPGTEDERKMAAVWSEVLGVPRVGLHDDFFRLGGHSLLATRIVARVRRDFDVQLPLRALFQAPTVARLLDAVGEARTAAAPPAAPRIASLSRSASNLRSRSAIGRKEGA